MTKFLKKKFALSDEGARGLVKASVASFFVFCISMVPAILLMLICDHLILGNVHETRLYVLLSAITLIIMYILLAIEYEKQYNETYKESAHLRIDLAKKMSKLPLSYFSKHNLSDLAQSIMADVTAIEHAMSHAMPKAIAFVFFLPLISILMLFGNWKMAVASVLPTIISFFLIVVAKNFSRRQFDKYYVTLRENSELFQETIELSREINSFNLAEKNKKALYKKMEESERIHWISEMKNAYIMMASGIFSQVSLGITIAVGAYLMGTGEINLLYLIGYILAAMKIKDAVDGNAEFFMELYYLDSMIKRISEIKNHEVFSGEETEFTNFDIALKDVAFSYNEGEKVISGLSFTAKQGEVTALVGPSGCGKTSLLRLISRLYDYSGGKILMGGKEIQKVSTESLYKNISIVFQDVTLFNTSVLENIRIGRKDATDEEVKEAARRANCDFIERLEKGFDTLIGENGAELSGGERQRLSIARAFLKDAAVLILDEIAASLDVDNEKKIQESLNTLIKNKTVIIISHRMRSIENVDKIVVLKDGKLEGEGTHAELLKSSPTYKNLIEKTKAAEDFVY